MEVMARGRFVGIDVANRRHSECIRGDRGVRAHASLLHRRDRHRQRKDVQGEQQDEGK
jgi:hypothetical protein